jgi:hypothetical protein
MRHYRVSCIILQHLMQQLRKVTIHPASHIMKDIQQQKGGIISVTINRPESKMRVSFIYPYLCSECGLFFTTLNKLHVSVCPI